MSFVYEFLAKIMAGCYHLTGNYGWAIVVFTFFTKIILLPLSLWTYFNEITMVKIQPDINFIKVKYYGQPDQIAEEQTKIYKEKKYSPLASIIPTVVQLFLLMGVVGVIKLGICNPEIDMHFGVINLGTVPVESGIKFLWSPVIAGFAAFVLCVAQNKSNILQSEQSKKSKYILTLFSIGLSLYLGWYVAVGTAFYWVCSNLFAVLQLYILNAIVHPRKYVDYIRLEESQRQLSEIQNVGKKKKEGFFSENKRRERADYKRFFSVVNKHLVFYSENNGFYKYFKGFIEYILIYTNLTIHYITSDPNDDIFELEKKNSKIRGYYIGENKLITLMMKMDADVVVMTMPDLENFHIKRSYVRDDIEYIFVQHGIGSNNMGMRKGCTDHFDTVFLSGIHQREEEEAIERYYKIKKRKLINVGYPLIDDMRATYERCTRNNTDSKKILIAPSWQKDNIIDVCLEKILDALKGNDYEIIVRPHPQEVRLKRERIDWLKSKYEQKGIEIQTDFTSNNPVLQADLLITDWSDISWEYAFTTLRPVLFINTPLKVMNPDYKNIDVIPFNIKLRDQVGIALDLEQLDNIKDTVDELLEKSDLYVEQINQLAHKYLYNLDGSGPVGAKYIIGTIQEKIEKRGKKQ